MDDTDKQTLRTLAVGVLAAVAALAAIGGVRWRRQQAWRGPLVKVDAKVLSCDSGYSSGAARGTRGGMRYLTRYEYADASGAKRRASTESLGHCAAPGTPLVVEWPEGRPELARAREK